MSMGITVNELADVQKRNSPSLLPLWSKSEVPLTTLSEVVVR